MERIGTTGFTSATDSGAPATPTAVCASCGQTIGGSKGLEQFLGKLGISEEMIANRATVDLSFIHTEGGHIQPRLRHTRAHLERAAEEWSGLRLAGILVPIRCAEACSPVVRMKQPGLNHCWFAPG